jgi:transcription termination factor Rho
VAELLLERVKRLVEEGEDVCVLLDSVTRLSRAYNLAAPASGRILSGGVDSAALYPPKKFFGAARNIENGGSLTILASALVETGSRMDEVIFEEFKGTGNMELRLDRKLANRRTYPAINIEDSSTRKEELLMEPAEAQRVWQVRTILNALDTGQKIELLIQKLKETHTNSEFLRELQRVRG